MPGSRPHPKRAWQACQLFADAFLVELQVAVRNKKQPSNRGKGGAEEEEEAPTPSAPLSAHALGSFP